MAHFTWKGVHYETLAEFNKAQNRANPSWWSKDRSINGETVVIRTSPEERQQTGIVAVMCVKGGIRPCILTPGCQGRMAATLRRYEGSQGVKLFWMCEKCHVTREEATSKAKWDPRALAVAQVMAQEEDLARKALENDGTVPKIVQAAALIEDAHEGPGLSADDEAWADEARKMHLINDGD